MDKRGVDDSTSEWSEFDGREACLGRRYRLQPPAEHEHATPLLTLVLAQMSVDERWVLSCRALLEDES